MGSLLLLRKLTHGGLVENGAPPGPMQAYLYQRTPTHLHRGIDIAAPRGSRVFAAQGGRVAALWPDGLVSGYGNTVVLQHPDGTQTLYAHLERFADGLSRGVTVKRRSPIGFVGTTQAPRPAMQSAPHLHFEAHRVHDLHVSEERPARFAPLAYLAARNMGVSV